VRNHDPVSICQREGNGKSHATAALLSHDKSHIRFWFRFFLLI
jgi:hypothetical protein